MRRRWSLWPASEWTARAKGIHHKQMQSQPNLDLISVSEAKLWSPTLPRAPTFLLSGCCSRVNSINNSHAWIRRCRSDERDEDSARESEWAASDSPSRTRSNVNYSAHGRQCCTRLASFGHHHCIVVHPQYFLAVNSLAMGQNGRWASFPSQVR